MVKRKLWLSLMVFLVVLGMVGGAKKVLAESFCVDVYRHTFIKDDQGSVTGISNDTSKATMNLNPGESYCDVDASYTGQVIRECKLNGNGVAEVVETGRCFQFIQGDGKCVESQNGDVLTAKCIYNSTYKCTSPQGVVRSGGEYGCINATQRARCDGYTGNFLPVEANDSECSGNVLCWDWNTIFGAGTASCKKADCTGTDNGVDIVASEGQVICFKSQSELKICKNGNFDNKESCGTSNCVYTNPSTKEGECLKAGEKLCLNVNSSSEGINPTAVGKEICFNEKTRYKCNNPPNFDKIEDCGSDQTCVYYPTDQNKPSECVNNNSLSGKTGQVGTPTQTTVAGSFCTGYSADNPAVLTALGCVPVTVSGFITWLLPILFGVAGGISFLLMVYGFIMVATSSGDEKKVQGAKETITSALIGLLVSIFALFIFRLVAINILHIPGIS